MLEVICHPKQEPTNGDDAAFTLVELLVVLGILVALLALILPAIGRARAQAQQVKCAAQLSQLGAALSSYANNNRGWLPAWGGWHVYPPGSPEDEPGLAWTEQLAPYYAEPNSPAYTCPMLGAQGVVTYFLAARWSASLNRHAMRFTEIRLASQFVLSGDNTNQVLYPPPYGAAPHHFPDCDPDDAQVSCATFTGPRGFLGHPGGNNILFGDLHVSAFAAFDSSQLTFDPNSIRRWDQVVPSNGK